MVRESGWNTVKLKDICDFIGGGTPSKQVENFWCGNIPWISSSDLIESSIWEINITRHITAEAVAKSATHICPRNTVLVVSRVGVGKVAIAPFEVCTSQDFTNLVSKKHDARFLAYCIQNKMKIMAEKTQGTSIKGVTVENIAQMEIELPPQEEQTAIAEALSDIDNLISSQQKLIEKKKAIKQGAMQELLTGKKRLPGFSGEWRTYKLGELGSFDKGCGISRAESNTGNFPAVRYGELYTKHTDYVKQYYSHISDDVAQTAKRVTFGDILFAASGETKEEIGVCAAIVDRRDIFAGGDIVVFTPTTEINPIFFGTLLNMSFVQKQKSERGQGDAVVHIHADSLSEIIVSMPEKNEQEAIAAVIKDFNDEIEQLEKKLVKYQQIKQGMMQELLTGHIRLKEGENNA